ncbi:MAG: tol-pal system-associated acyl-CoA thioesterase [Rickettsiales bacterium]|nr:tol-pal system-associated acyl-CoA thioesterase [Rickettsiales bacterium]
MNNLSKKSAVNFFAQYRVYYEDTDAGGVMYYANYLKFFERARTDFLRNLGISQNELIEKEKIAFVVRRCELDYLRPARLDDLVEVTVVVEEINAASIVMRQEMQKDKVVLACLKVEIVCVDVESFKPKKIAEKIKVLL